MEERKSSSHSRYGLGHLGYERGSIVRAVGVKYVSP